MRRATRGSQYQKQEKTKNKMDEKVYQNLTNAKHFLQITITNICNTQVE
jgi:hypothetical protein